MAVLLRGRSLFVQSGLSKIPRLAVSASYCTPTSKHEPTTHTGQQFTQEDYRRIRFAGKDKLINPNFAVNLIAEDKVVVCQQRMVSSDGGGALGHPKVFINLDKPGIHSCTYSGRKFVHAKYYDAATMGPSVTYEQFLAETRS